MMGMKTSHLFVRVREDEQPDRREDQARRVDHLGPAASGEGDERERHREGHYVVPTARPAPVHPDRLLEGVRCLVARAPDRLGQRGRDELPVTGEPVPLEEVDQREFAARSASRRWPPRSHRASAGRCRPGFLARIAASSPGWADLRGAEHRDQHAADRADRAEHERAEHPSRDPRLVPPLISFWKTKRCWPR